MTKDIPLDAMLEMRERIIEKLFALEDKFELTDRQRSIYADLEDSYNEIQQTIEEYKAETTYVE